MSPFQHVGETTHGNPTTLSSRLELEHRWNERLVAVHSLEDERDTLAAGPQSSLTVTERQRLFELGDDVERAWDSPGATPAIRKRIIRTLIEEIVVRVEDDALTLVIRWQGGDHTPLRVRKRPAWASIGGVRMPM